MIDLSYAADISTKAATVIYHVIESAKVVDEMDHQTEEDTLFRIWVGSHTIKRYEFLLFFAKQTPPYQVSNDKW